MKGLPRGGGEDLFEKCKSRSCKSERETVKDKKEGDKT